jgi:hypothetical protein
MDGLNDVPGDRIGEMVGDETFGDEISRHSEACPLEAPRSVWTAACLSTSKLSSEESLMSIEVTSAACELGNRADEWEAIVRVLRAPKGGATRVFSWSASSRAAIRQRESISCLNGRWMTKKTPKQIRRGGLNLFLLMTLLTHLIHHCRYLPQEKSFFKQMPS